MLAFSCPVTATSTECPRRISGHTHDSTSLPVSAPLARHLVHEGPVVPQRTEKFCLLLGSAGIHTPSEAKHYLKAVLKYCQCVPMQQAKAGFRWTCAVSCPPLCLQPSQEGRWGQTEEGMSCGARLTPLSGTARRWGKNHTADFEWKNHKPRLSLQSTEKNHQTWALCFLMPGTLRWNGYVKVIPTSSLPLWSMRGGERGPGLILSL